MTTSENPFRRAYWFGEVDARPLALFRILFGSVVLFDSLRRLPDVLFFFSDDGYAPRDALPALAHTWSLFRLVGSPGAVWCVYWAGILAALALTLGFRTRIASVAVFVFLASLHLRNPVIAIGPDRIMAVLSFWLGFADAGAAFSLDRRLGRVASATIPAAGVRFLQWQVALIYFFAAVAKRTVWGGGLGLFHFLQVRDVARPLGALLTRWPPLTIALNWLVLVAEAGVPLLLIPLRPLAPKATRISGLAIGLALFIGISLTMRVGSFPFLMIAALALFLEPEWLDRIGAVDRTPIAEAPPAAPRQRLLLLGLGGLQLGLLGWSLVSFNLGWPSVRLVEGEIDHLDLGQSWTMFAKPAVPYSAWWTGVGILANGGRTQVLESLTPQLVATEPRPDWENFRRHLMLTASRHERGLFGRYICRKYNVAAAEPIQELELTMHGQPVHDPGAPPTEEPLRQVYHLHCAGEPEGESD